MLKHVGCFSYACVQTERNRRVRKERKGKNNRKYASIHVPSHCAPATQPPLWGPLSARTFSRRTCTQGERSSGPSACSWTNSRSRCMYCIVYVCVRVCWRVRVRVCGPLSARTFSRRTCTQGEGSSGPSACSWTSSRSRCMLDVCACVRVFKREMFGLH